MAPALWKIKPPIEPTSGGVWVGPGAAPGKDGIWFGMLAEIVTGKQPQVWIATNKEQVIAVVGKRGSGKSFTLGVIAEGLSLASDSPTISKQTRPRATLLFDPLDVYWTSRFPVAPTQNVEANRHYELAKAMKLADATFNVGAWVPGTSNQRSSDPSWFQLLQLPVPLLGMDEWGLILDINVLSEPMGQALAEIRNLIARTGYHMRGTTVPARAVYNISDLVAVIDADEMINYHAETLRALRQRLGSLHNTGLFSATGTPIGDLLAPGRLSVILLGRLAQEYRSAIVALVTRMLVEERSRVAFAEKRLELDPTLSDEDKVSLRAAIASGVPRTVVALDEAQSFLSPDRGNVARDVFIRLVKEGRNMGLSAVIATQQPSAIDSRVLSQVETFISHQLVTATDIQAVRANLKSGMPDSAEFGKQEVDSGDLLRMLGPGQCLVSAADMNTTIRRSMIVNVRPRATVHGGIEL